MSFYTPERARVSVEDLQRLSGLQVQFVVGSAEGVLGLRVWRVEGDVVRWKLDVASLALAVRLV